MRWEKTISKIFSAPLFSLYLLPFIVQHETNMDILKIALAVIYLSILPIALLLVDFFRGKTDLFVSKREARSKYFAWATAVYGLGTIHFRVLNNKLIFLFLACYTTVTLSMMLLTYFTKVSVHASGTAGPITYMILVINPMWFLAYIVIPIVAYARIKEKAHTLKEVIIATIVSIIVTAATLETLATQ